MQHKTFYNGRNTDYSVNLEVFNILYMLKISHQCSSKKKYQRCVNPRQSLAALGDVGETVSSVNALICPWIDRSL